MSRAWKDLEKKTAAALGGTRINRADDYGRSDVDVVIAGHPYLRVDCKYRKRHAHHALVEEIREKYCVAGQWPVLVSKHRRSQREYVTVDLVLFAALLKLIEDEFGSENISGAINAVVPSEDGTVSSGNEGDAGVDRTGG